MANNIIISITTLDNGPTIDITNPRSAAEHISNFMNRAAGGCSLGTKMDVQVNGGTGAYASGTLTLSSVVAGNTCAVAGQTFTAATSPSGNNQFGVGVSDTVTAANLAAKISAHPSLQRTVAAASSGAVVTITAAMVGIVGNYIPTTGSTDIVASAATLAGGTDPSAQVLHLGL